MPILNDILRENLEYYKDLERRYEARLRALPRGSLLRRRIGAGDYYYLVFREGKRVVSRYLGKAEPAGMRDKIAERRQIKRQLKEVRANLRLLERVRGRRKNGRALRKHH